VASISTGLAELDGFFSAADGATFLRQLAS
jgi:hypothetical protein